MENNESNKIFESFRSSVSNENEESYIYTEINQNKKANQNKLGRSLYNQKNAQNDNRISEISFLAQQQNIQQMIQDQNNQKGTRKTVLDYPQPNSYTQDNFLNKSQTNLSKQQAKSQRTTLFSNPIQVQKSEEGNDQQILKSKQSIQQLNYPELDDSQNPKLMNRLVPLKESPKIGEKQQAPANTCVTQNTPQETPGGTPGCTPGFQDDQNCDEFGNCYTNNILRILGVHKRNMERVIDQYGANQDPESREKYTISELDSLMNEYLQVQERIKEVQFKIISKRFNQEVLKDKIEIAKQQTLKPQNKSLFQRIRNKFKKSKKGKIMKEEIHLHSDPDQDLLQILEENRGKIINEKRLRNTIMSNLLVNEAGIKEIRKKLWLIVSNVDDLVNQLLYEFNENIEEQFIKKQSDDIPIFLKTAEQFYQYFRQKRRMDVDINYRIMDWDIQRTRRAEGVYQIDYSSGKNPIYNLLNAYAQFDHSVGYCQGMSFIADLLLRHIGDEMLCFFVLIHIMKVHKWQGCFENGFPKQLYLLDVISNILEGAWPNVYMHIMEEIEVNLYPVFGPSFQCVFLYQCPDINVAAHIWDAFLLDGEEVVVTLLLNSIKRKEEKILSLYSDDLKNYLQKEMITECINECNMHELLD